MPQRNLEKRRAYQKIWREKNRERLRQYQKDWYAKNPEKQREIKRKWKKQNPWYDEKYYQENKERIAKKAKERADKLRIDALMVYSNGEMMCECCGERSIEFLTIDHLKNAPHTRNNSKCGGREIFKWLKDNGYPDGFRVLCMNCNWARGQYGYCPHKEKKEIA